MDDFSETQMRVIQDTKDLARHIRENEARYISGELNLEVEMNKTDKLYMEIASAKTSATQVLHDSGLIKLQSKIAKECVRNYQADTLVFDPRVFCEKIKNMFAPNDVSNDDDNNANTSRRNAFPKVWEELGEECRKVENVVPPFSFIYGTFDAEPVEVVKKVRRQQTKDKVGDLTRPEAVNPGAVNEQDIMLRDANRVYNILRLLLKKSDKNAICFFEFVTDPDSFTRTVENAFLVSLLVKEGHVCIFPDEKGLPCIKKVDPAEKEGWDCDSMQSVLSLDMQDWKNIVKTFKFTKALIPPRTTQAASND